MWWVGDPGFEIRKPALFQKSAKSTLLRHIQWTQTENNLWFSNICKHQNHLENWLKHRLVILMTEVSDLLSLKWSSRICVFNQFPDDDHADGLEATFWELLVQTRYTKPWRSRHSIVVCCSATKLCQTLSNPMDCSPPGSFVHGMSQATMLEWVAISFSRGIFWTQGSNPCLLHWQVGSLPLSQGGRYPVHFSMLWPMKVLASAGGNWTWGSPIGSHLLASLASAAYQGEATSLNVHKGPH